MTDEQLINHLSKGLGDKPGYDTQVQVTENRNELGLEPFRLVLKNNKALCIEA